MHTKHHGEPLKEIDLQIGDYRIFPVPTGIFGLDGGAMFGTVPKVLWEKSIPADDKNRIPMEARALLLKSEKRNVLIDCGNGDSFVEKYGEKLGPKFAQMYNLSSDGPTLEKSLKQCGVAFEDITDVILTHLHFDHCGGGTRAINGKIVPTFSKARYYVQKENLEAAQNPNLREKASYFSANFQPLIDSGKLTVLEGNASQVIPGISVEVSHGHTRGQQVVKVSDGQLTLLYCADLIPTSSHVRVPWIMGYDLNPLLIMEEKRKILNQAANENWILFFEHDPFADCARISHKDGDFAVVERQRLRIS